MWTDIKETNRFIINLTAIMAHEELIITFFTAYFAETVNNDKTDGHDQKEKYHIVEVRKP